MVSPQTPPPAKRPSRSPVPVTRSHTSPSLFAPAAATAVSCAGPGTRPRRPGCRLYPFLAPSGPLSLASFSSVPRGRGSWHIPMTYHRLVFTDVRNLGQKSGKFKSFPDGFIHHFSSLIRLPNNLRAYYLLLCKKCLFLFVNDWF